MLCFSVEHRQDFQIALGGGGVDGCMVTKINRGCEFTYYVLYCVHKKAELTDSH